MADVQTDFATKTADVTMKPGRTLTQDDCAKAFQSTKYSVANFAETK